MNRVPSYRLHRPTGQAVVTIPTKHGRRDIYLGAWNSPKSKQEYARIVAELSAAGSGQSICPPDGGVTVAELLLAFWKFAESHYPTKSRLDAFRAAMKPVRELYGHRPATEFGPLAFKTVRDAYTRTGIVRGGVNRRVSDVKHIFKWAASEQLIPVGVFQALATVEGVRKGRTSLKESKKVPPVSDADVDATLPHLPPPVAAMVQLQRFTGMRPQEVCRLRPREIDATGDVWLYRPEHHKTAHAGKDRVVAIGPKGQAALRDHLPADPDEFCFSPAKTHAAVLALRSANRKTPRYPSHMRHNERRRKGRAYRDSYSVASYRQCIERACGRAGVAVWKPNQLRHAFATHARAVAGLDAVQAALGHAKADTTQIYAELATGKAVQLAKLIG